ncbi:MAG: hypothetical protein AB7P14_05275 [Blastocatellales bacterium]
MFNLNALDNLIAVVVVLLVLSLIVQSVQNATKRLFRVKSLQLEQSLVHLFYFALDKDAGKITKSLADRMPLLRSFASLPGLRLLMPKTATHLSARDSQVRMLFDAISKEIIKSGRVTPAGKVSLDGLSKADLLKFIGNLSAGKLLERLSGDDADKLKNAAGQIAAVNQTLSDFNDKYQSLIEKTPLAKYYDPLVQMLAGAAKLSQSDLDEMTLSDLSAFGKKEFGDADKLIEALPSSLQLTIQRLESDAQKSAAESLSKLKEAFDPIRQDLQSIVALPARIGQLSSRVDEWYSTIMQGFEERYNRSMKTFALVISFLTVLLLNANIFAVYRQISSNDQMRAQLISAGQQISQKLSEQRAAGQTNATQTDTTINQIADQTVKEIQENTRLYTSFGFEGPKWIARVLKDPRTIFSRGAFETITGWLVMTMLLSVGAPFWQDTLESLFGLKNYLRKQQQAVETR